jgi:hypothetical protein
MPLLGEHRSESRGNILHAGELVVVRGRVHRGIAAGG